MDLIPIIDNKDYLITDENLSIVQFSSNSQKYVNCDQNIALGKDIRTILPEIVGLESICEEILLGQQESFVLESITRSQEEDKDIYFDLYIKSIENYLVVLFEDVTNLTLNKQKSVQRLNEVEIALNKLQRFEYCTNKIIASMRDVLLITTPQGTIERVNKSTTDLFGQKKSELLNQSIDNIIQDKTFNHQQIYNYLLSSQESVSKIEVNFISKQKKEIQIEFDCFIAPTEIKNFFNCVYIGRDITARKKAEAEIRNSLAREQELRQLKSGFISMASHEFRNPLSSILLCVQNLSSEENLNDSDRKFYLQSIQDAALNMNSLLEDVLILSKAESGKQKLQLAPLDLEVFCSQIIQELESIYADKKVNFSYLVEINPAFLDKTTLRHILSNLLSNALKYSRPGDTVDLKMSNSQEPAEIVIEVRDRGIGIPEESQKHIFESFYRASNVDNTAGTGLGLSIVKKAVELYQGSITIESQVNQGTHILVKLPVNNN
ncbi:PAS domain-containing sensor histidine kinase [Pleurocapsa sp. PCC 7319]|uniref:sensor histidine kinase n=1 Tax=Pleurocapsa sp. PCC 7319 TaxID=118161 RepID=UPI00036D74D7|nr:PAS domain-containing sensor histidine kinase [Pleurocapsa sp. PCC 7319]